MFAYKGIVLAGGTGSRLHPITHGVSKQLLPIYNKPMVYYPLSVLMLAGIRDILMITTLEDQAQFVRLLGDGSRFGVHLHYAVQQKPNGIAEAFIIGAEFIANNPVCLILGDNIFYSEGLSGRLKHATQRTQGATIFGARVSNPSQFGVLGFDAAGRVASITEKPAIPASSYAATGLYFYDHTVVDIARTLTPSSRGELEITDVNNAYLTQGNLHVELMGRGFAWLDTGTYDSLLEAQHYIHTLEKRHGLQVACLEEIGWRQGWLTDTQLAASARMYHKTSYGQYLEEVLNVGKC